MKAFSVRTAISASPETIWALLTAAARYTQWNSTVECVEGNIALGERITVRPTINPQRAFPVRVAVFDPPRRMVWTGGLPFGLFKGERTFTLQPGLPGSVEFSMREEYTGILASLIARSIPNLQPAFDAFASDLKNAAQAQ
jgi:hypothetical protein